MTRAEAMRHPNVLGAGARKREHLKPKDKVAVVMSEFKRGTLHSGSGGIVKNRKQAIAIAMSEARKHKGEATARAGADTYVPRTRMVCSGYDPNPE